MFIINSQCGQITYPHRENILLCIQVYGMYVCVRPCIRMRFHISEVIWMQVAFINNTCCSGRRVIVAGIRNTARVSVYPLLCSVCNNTSQTNNALVWTSKCTVLGKHFAHCSLRRIINRSVGLLFCCTVCFIFCLHLHFRLHFSNYYFVVLQTNVLLMNQPISDVTEITWSYTLFIEKRLGDMFAEYAVYLLIPFCYVFL